MALITDSWQKDIAVSLITILIFVYYYLKSAYYLWEKKKVPYAEPVLGLGSLLPLYLNKKAYAEVLDDLYKQFEGEKFFGFYQYIKPCLMVRDPELIERVMIKDFNHFVDRGLPIDEENEPLSINLVNLTGDKWRSLRYKLTPTFTSGKLKGMFYTLCECGDGLLKTIEGFTKSGEDVNTKELIYEYTVEVIASVAFGLQIKYNSEEGRKFRQMVDETQGITTRGALRWALRFFAPNFSKFLGIRAYPKTAYEYFMGITKATMEHRLKNNIKREDFFHLLMTLKEQEEKQSFVNLENEGIEKDDIQLHYTVKPLRAENILKITDDVVAAQSFVFLAAGSETVSTTLTVVLHHLSQNPLVQQKLQAEVDNVLAKYGGNWTYNALKEMVYLDQIIQESQRLFPIAYAHLRVCTSPYKIPDTDVVIDKGMSVIIPVHGLQMDPKYYPDPEIFNPDRFVGNNFKPSPIFSPFGDGPRICIAMRFAIVEMKVFIARVMSKYSVLKSEKTELPLRFDHISVQSRTRSAIYVRFEKRNL